MSKKVPFFKLTRAACRLPTTISESGWGSTGLKCYDSKKAWRFKTAILYMEISFLSKSVIANA